MGNIMVSHLSLARSRYAAIMYGYFLVTFSDPGLQI